MVATDPAFNKIVYEITSSFSNLCINHENIKHFTINRNVSIEYLSLNVSILVEYSLRPRNAGALVI